MFRNRPMVVGTMHRKEQAISPIFQEELQVLPFVPIGFQTDFLGTFTGEVTRLQTAKETVKDKCLAAMQFSNCEMGVATEASFGPHPEVFYAAAHEEWMVFVDIKHGLEVFERVFTTNTNYAHQEISDWIDLEKFANKVGFPVHGIILSNSDKSVFYKDITTWKQLQMAFEELKKSVFLVCVETDMRAHRNPTRMSVIRQLAEKLVEKIKSKCPNCSTPGFGVTSTIFGLPCEWCGAPTNSIATYIKECTRCGFKEHETRKDKTTESAEFCYQCNP